MPNKELNRKKMGLTVKGLIKLVAIIFSETGLSFTEFPNKEWKRKKMWLTVKGIIKIPTEWKQIPNIYLNDGTLKSIT